MAVSSGSLTKTAPYPMDGKYPTKFERIIYRLRNAMFNRLYPIHPLIYISLFIATMAYQFEFRLTNWLLSSSANDSPILQFIEKAMLSLAIAYVPVFVIRCLLRRYYFSYKEFIFEDRRDPSLRTKLWMIIHRILSYTSPRLCSCDSMLPKLPVPALKDTIARYLESVEPILSKEEFDEVSRMAKDFERNEGKKLQLLTWLYSCFTSNYVSNFWEKYAYHYSREGLLINSSVGYCDLFTECIPANQAVRAAHICYVETLSMLAVDKETLKRIGEGLLCMSHYRKMYATTRTPGHRIDHLDNYRLSRHVAVYYRGNFYKVEMFDEYNRIYSIPQLSNVFADILTRDDHATEAEVHLAALTTDKRDSWHANRQRFFIANAINKETLKIIETAIAFVILDECTEYEYNAEKPERLDNFMRNMLTGNGRNRWADKSVNYCISATGRGGGTTEHSIGDGVEFDHVMENFVYVDKVILRNEYPSVVEEVKSPFANGNINSNDTAEMKAMRFKRAERLEFDISEEMKSEIERCYKEFKPKIDDVDMASLIFRTFGKGAIKDGKISPDGFVQMGLQLAIYKDQNKFVLTYESASARFYANSRTETLRSVSKESCAFVKAMMDPNCTKEEKYRLLQIACEKHVQRNRECMVGKGVDRHLFVLYIISRATSTSSPFLNYYIEQPWTLSTSQAPTLTGLWDEDGKPQDSWLGASFGPVTKNGYGVCYRFAGNHSICAHISSLKSADNTDSHRFKKHLEDAFIEMASLFPKQTSSNSS